MPFSLLFLKSHPGNTGFFPSSPCSRRGRRVRALLSLLPWLVCFPGAEPHRPLHPPFPPVHPSLPRGPLLGLMRARLSARSGCATVGPPAPWLVDGLALGANEVASAFWALDGVGDGAALLGGACSWGAQSSQALLPELPPSPRGSLGLPGISWSREELGALTLLPGSPVSSGSQTRGGEANLVHGAASL